MENLKILRKELGISQQRLADKFNVSQQSIYKYEHNLAEPDILTLKKLADFFHTSVDFLIGHDTSECFCTENNLDRRELNHLFMYRKLNETQKTKLDEFLQTIIPEKIN